MPVEGSAPCNEEEIKFRCRACGTWISGPRAHIGHGAPCPTCRRWVVVPYGRQDDNGGNAAVSLKVVEQEDEWLDEVRAKKSLRWQLGVVVGRLRVLKPPRLAWIAAPVVLVLGYLMLKCAG